MALNFLRRSYQPTKTADPDDGSVEVVDGQEPGDINMSKEDLIRAMRQLQADDTVPAQTRELINQISQKFLGPGPDRPDDDDGLSPAGSDAELSSPTGSERSGPAASNPKTVEELTRIMSMLQAAQGSQRVAAAGAAPQGGVEMSDRDYLHARGIASFTNGVPAYAGASIGVGVDLDTSTGPGTPTHYKGAKNPQNTKYHPSRNFLIGVAAINMLAGVVYIYWRCARSMVGVMTNWFAWVFLFGEIVITLAAWQSHCSRFFPVKREKCTMDDLVRVDRTIGSRTPVTIFLPTAGEILKVIRMALLGQLSMRLWDSELLPCNQLRVIVLDEKRRREVIILVSLCYKFSSIFANDPQVKAMMKRDRVPEITPRGLYRFYEQCAAQFGRRWHSVYTEAFGIAAMIEKLCAENKIPDAWDQIELPRGRDVPASLTVHGDKPPRLREDFDEVPNIPSIIYFSRRNPGEPYISPKAGNMNSVLFPEDPVDADVLNGSRFVVINDARHAFEPEYLQRVVPYFFELKKVDGKYTYTVANRVAFIQVPQRFQDRGDGDPFGNRSAVMFDVTNIGRDGVGGVMSCGQGSIWRVDVLHGATSDGKKSNIDPLQIRQLVGTKLGYSQLSRIEDTMTSIGLFSRGFKSVYINEEQEFLGWCSQEPDNMDWRIKQLFRWHYGAVELFNMGIFRLQEGRFPTLWHRIYVWESCTYFFQAISAQIFLAMPIWYCFTWTPPFTTYKTEFVAYLLPYFLTAILPTMIGLGWRKVHPDLALREEQVWMATAYVQLYAFISSVFQGIKKATTALGRDADGNAASNWNIDCPTWPLYGIFAAEVAGMIVTSVRWFRTGFDQPWVWVSSMGGAAMAIWMLWPVVIKGLKLPPLSKFYMRYIALAAFIVIVAAWQK